MSEPANPPRSWHKFLLPFLVAIQFLTRVPVPSQSYEADALSRAAKFFPFVGLLIGASANQLAIMVGVPAINDGYGTEDMREKLERYQPGWYVGWHDVDPASEDFLSGYRLQKIAIYEALDDDDRGSLTLYKMVRR